MSYINAVYVSFIIQAPMMFFQVKNRTHILGGKLPISDGLCSLAFAQGVQARGQTHDVKGLPGGIRGGRGRMVGGVRVSETPIFWRKKILHFFGVKFLRRNDLGLGMKPWKGYPYDFCQKSSMFRAYTSRGKYLRLFGQNVLESRGENILF